MNSEGIVFEVEVTGKKLSESQRKGLGCGVRGWCGDLKIRYIDHPSLD